MALLLDIPTHADVRGSLSVLDAIVPFPIRRVYCIHDVPSDRSRAGHRHLRNRQVVACLAGRCEVRVHDGQRPQSFVLDSAAKALLLESADWHRIDRVSPGSVLLVVASEEYDPGDYVYEAYA